MRGPPGTHDLGLLERTLTRLRAAGSGDRTPLPSFDKLPDDRRLEADWPVFRGRPRAILLEGWCLGAMPQDEADLRAPINALERDDDTDGRWRRAINDALASGYARLFATFDALLFLQAPDFDRVLDWRTEQEAGLTGAPVPASRCAELSRFVQHFERISRHMLEGGVAADVVVELDRNRAPTAIRSVTGP